MGKNKYPNLLKPGKVGSLELENRVIFCPTESLCATVNGEVSQRMIDYFVRRAEGEAAMIVVNSAAANTKIDPIHPYVGTVRIDDDVYIPRLSDLVEAVHRKGSKVALLVSPGSGAQALGQPYDHGNEGLHSLTNVGVSEIKCPLANREVKPLTVDEIEKIVKIYGLAAGRVKRAGFDALYIHALGGDLTAQFISPYFNIRDDKYGKNFEGRIRFLLELVESSKKYVGPDFPIVVRMSIDEFFPGGRKVEESVLIAKRLEEAGVNAIDASAGIHASLHMLIPPVYLEKGCLVSLAEAVKKEVKIPVITQGRLYDPELAEEVLRNEKADFIGLSRGLVCDPDWVKKIKDDREHEIRRCISCNYCIARDLASLPIRCALNPVTGRESQYRDIPPKTANPKKVVIVGAGPGGMEAARIAAAKGHNVKLFERSAELGGGQLKLARIPPCKDEFVNITNYYSSQFEKMYNLNIVFNKECTAEDIKKEKPDVVILATGATPLIPGDIEGLKISHAVTAWEVLSGKQSVKGKAVIVGGGVVGLETADFLSEKGVGVSVVEMLDDVGLDEEPITRNVLLSRLKQKGVHILTRKKMERVADKAVMVRNRDNDALEPIEYDYVVLALGASSYNPLEEDLRGEVKELYTIGDAKQARKISDAVYEGFYVAYDRT